MSPLLNVLFLLLFPLLERGASESASLDQVLIGLRSASPITASDFLAAIAQLPYRVSPKLQPPQLSKSHNEIFREYYTEDDTVSEVRIDASNKPSSLKRPFSPILLQDIPPSANCEPELQTVHLAHLINDSISSNKTRSKSGASLSDIYFPHCIRLAKCGGCCPSARLRCTPTNVTRQTISVMHMRYSTMDRRFQLAGLKRIQVERHGQCACECIIKRTDCARGQLYRPDECRCICPPTAKLTCLARQRSAVTTNVANRALVWNALKCECECKPPGGRLRCSAGLKFDPITCSCLKKLQSAPKFVAKSYKIANGTAA